MANREGRDYLYLVWKDPMYRRQYVVGELSKNGQYEFKYGGEVNDAMKCGFLPLTSFEYLDKIYSDSKLFSAFSSRLPDKKRRDIAAILSKYGLKEYDEYQLLKKSGAKLPIDELMFFDPIFEDELKVDRIFYLAGVHYYLGCEGQTCDDTPLLTIGAELELVPEPTNDHDPNAIKVFTNNNIFVGYVPRYYSPGILDLMKQKAKVGIEILEANKDHNCNECIRVRLYANQ